VSVPIIQTKTASKRKKHSEILTNTPMKKILEEKKEKQISRQETKKSKEKEMVKKKKISKKKEKYKEKENMPINKKPKIKNRKSVRNLRGFEESN